MRPQYALTGAARSKTLTPRNGSASDGCRSDIRLRPLLRTGRATEARRDEGVDAAPRLGRHRGREHVEAVQRLRVHLEPAAVAGGRPPLVHEEGVVDQGVGRTDGEQ